MVDQTVVTHSRKGDSLVSVHDTLDLMLRFGDLLCHIFGIILVLIGIKINQKK